jgi:hypothetical protein
MTWLEYDILVNEFLFYEFQIFRSYEVVVEYLGYKP